MYHKEETSSC